MQHIYIFSPYVPLEYICKRECKLGNDKIKWHFLYLEIKVMY